MLKELDEETRLYYYGARYYDPRVNVWYGTDPKQEESQISALSHIALKIL
jgi:RHS repeat-associated protein